MEHVITETNKQTNKQTNPQTLMTIWKTEYPVNQKYSFIYWMVHANSQSSITVHVRESVLNARILFGISRQSFSFFFFFLSRGSSYSGFFDHFQREDFPFLSFLNYQLGLLFSVEGWLAYFFPAWRKSVCLLFIRVCMALCLLGN